MPASSRLDPSALYRACAPDELLFETTAELADEPPGLGQERAHAALRLATSLEHPGYNVFAAGSNGLGRHALIRAHLEARAKAVPSPSDWCYVHSFEDARRPHALELPQGKGRSFRADLRSAVEELRVSLVAAFESDDYRTRRDAIAHRFEERQEHAIDELRTRARSRGVALVPTPVGLAFAPIHENEIMPPEVFSRLPPERQAELQKSIGELETELGAALSQVPRWAKEARDHKRALDREVSSLAVEHIMEELCQRYTDLPAVVAWLRSATTDILEHTEDFLPAEADEGPLAVLDLHHRRETAALRRYAVNLLVHHEHPGSAPIVCEEHPSFEHLLGRLEHEAELGAVTTDFTLIAPGALHRANGGYLLVDAHRVLGQPYAWEALKRALRTRQLRITSLAQELGLSTAVTLEPEPIPLRVRVVLFGEPWLYHLLAAYDADFEALFKLVADFEDDVPRTPETTNRLARLLATRARAESLPPLHRDAVARLVEHAARAAGDAHRLSLDLEDASDLVREAAWHAKADTSSLVLSPSEGDAPPLILRASHLQDAIDARHLRHGKPREHTLRAIREGFLFVDTHGERVGQVNGLSVLTLGRASFGRPVRITARVRLGRGEVLDIEREVELGGPLHSKGVLILSSFVGSRYVTEAPLGLSASLVFEQSYGGIDGDSASLAELCALLSAIAEVPLRQSVALTGSVNQHGDVQPIGGVNEKIEGFFEVASAKGLDGSQGVLIPASNQRNLMLREEVRDAVRDGRFFVQTVSHVDEALEVLCGLPAGARGEGIDGVPGLYPEGSFNRTVADRLAAAAERLRGYTSGSAPAGGKT